MNHLNWSRSAGIALTATLVTFCCPAVHAADWNGSTSTDWNTVSNWSGGTVPNGEGAVVNTTTGNIATLSSTPATDPTELAVGLWGGTGRLDHVGGSINATVRVLIGAGANGTGTYNLANTATAGGSLTGFGTGAGSLTTPDIFLGDPFGQAGSTGTFNINTSGTVATQSRFVVGLNSSTTSTVSLDAGTITVGTDLNVGDTVGIGVFNQSGGSVATINLTNIGNGTGSTGTYNLTGGSLSAGGELWVGQNGTATFNQSGGTVSSANWFVIGRDNGSNGTYNLSGGTVNAATGGGQTVLSSFTGGTSTLNVSGGTFNATNDLFVGEGGNGTLNVSGNGTVTTGEFAYVRVAQAGGAGVVNLNGGTLQTGGVTKGGGSSAVVNFNGGTLKASNNQFISGLTHAYVKAGGAVIDTNGFDAWVAQDLEGDIASTGGGLIKNGEGTLTLTGANTYTGNTKVNTGTLSVQSASFADTSTITIAAGAILNLDTGVSDTVNRLVIGGVTKAAGIWGATDSGATNIDDTHFTGTGVLSVTTGPADYAGWAGTNVGGGTPSADYDNDGVANGVEYFMNAASGLTALPPIVNSGGSYSITWANGGNIPASAYGTQFVVQISTNLINWTNVPSGSLTTNTDGPGGKLKYIITGPGKQFVRLKVTPN